MRENLRRLNEFVREQNAVKRPRSCAREESRMKGYHKGDVNSTILRGFSRKEESGSVERSVEIALEESIVLQEGKISVGS